MLQREQESTVKYHQTPEKSSIAFHRETAKEWHRTHQQARRESRPLIGSFNNHSLTFHPHDASFASTVSCVGENFHMSDAWMFRSCDYSNLCFDTQRGDFVVVTTPLQQQMEKQLTKHNSFTRFTYENKAKRAWEYIKNPVTISTSLYLNLSLGGLNPNWQNKYLKSLALQQDAEEYASGLDTLRWSPRVLTQEEFMKDTLGFYMLPSNVLMIPFHSHGAIDAVQVLLDDFLPIFTIMNIFDYLDRQPVLIRHAILPSQTKPLWESCDSQEQSKNRCQTFFTNLLPLMRTSWDQMSTTQDFRLELKEGETKSKYVCSERGVAGLGMVTDHGLKKNGWEVEDYETMHNIGRGDALYQFRNYLMLNMGFSRSQIKLNLLGRGDKRHKIVVSHLSSQSDEPWNDYLVEVDSTLKSLNSVIVKPADFLHTNVKEQTDLVHDASIMITSAGSGAVTAMFLPRGSSLIIYYDDEFSEGEHVESGHLDWDFWNNLSYLRVHWLPIRRMYKSKDTNTLLHLIQAEIKYMEHHRQS